MKIAVLAGAVTAALMMSTAQGAVRIKADPGGQIGPYLENLVALRSSGERVIIDGPCLSACTMVLGVIPHERICVTARARISCGVASRRRRPSGTEPGGHQASDGHLSRARAQLDRSPWRSLSAHDVFKRSRAHRDVPDLR
jgi:hypothetical protein